MSTLGSNHAVTDPQSRLRKAKKIEALLNIDLRGKRLLDLGCGSGFLSQYFRDAGAEVFAADPRDQIVPSDINFITLNGPDLPFEDEMFDIIVFNHVIEHVGDNRKQRDIIDEIQRILKPDGVLYVAVPNKWALIEPHFRLPFLGAMPKWLAHSLVRRMRGASHYDCHPLSNGQLRNLLSRKFPSVNDISLQAVEWVVANEMTGIGSALMRRIPRLIIKQLLFAFPTYIMLARKQSEGRSPVSKSSQL